jgi:hypothetical protein
VPSVLSDGTLDDTARSSSSSSSSIDELQQQASSSSSECSQLLQPPPASPSLLLYALHKKSGICTSPSEFTLTPFSSPFLPSMSRKVPSSWDSVQDAQSAELERRIQADQAQALQRTVDEKTLRNINRIVIEILKANHNEHGDAILAQSVLEFRLRARMREENQMFDEDRDFCRLNEPDVLKLFRRPNSGVTVLQDGKVALPSLPLPASINFNTLCMSLLTTWKCCGVTA